MPGKPAPPPRARAQRAATRARRPRRKPRATHTDPAAPPQTPHAGNPRWEGPLLGDPRAGRAGHRVDINPQRALRLALQFRLGAVILPGGRSHDRAGEQRQQEEHAADQGDATLKRRRRLDR